ncbi:MAG: hypothetical protein JNJ45_07715 [Chthonomonas sp.]|nr:hypothetical protein [Chthonomonas sp.]
MKKWLLLAVLVGLVGCSGEAPTADPAPANSTVPGKNDGNAASDGQLSINKDYEAPKDK